MQTRINSHSLRHLRCGKNHSGNDNVSRLCAGFVQCAGCGQIYTEREARVVFSTRRSGVKGSGKLYFTL